MTTDFHDICESLRARTSRGRKLKRLTELLEPLLEADRLLLAGLLTRRTPSIPIELASKRPFARAGTRKLSFRDVQAALDGFENDRVPTERLERLVRLLEALEPSTGDDFLALATGSLSLGVSSSLVNEALAMVGSARRARAGTLYGVVVEFDRGEATFAVRGIEGFVEVARASLPVDEGLRRIIDGLVVERAGDRLLLRPELVFELGFDAVHRDARWASGFVLRQPEVVEWRRERHPFMADTIERVVELYEESRALAEPRLSAPPPVRKVDVDDLPLFGGVESKSNEPETPLEGTPSQTV